MRPVPLTVMKGGINRLRTKGGARADNLYDLVNGQLTESGTIKSRAGTYRITTVNTAAKGLVSFNGSLHVFSHTSVDVPAGFELHILVHPTDASNPAITRIHFAAPFLGSLYVVAEFEGGDVFHYWQNSSGEWTADTAYDAGDIITPTEPSGLLYRATRLGAPYPAWQAGAPRELKDIIEPTVYNGFYYTVIDTQGLNPASGQVEPTWPTEAGAQVIEDTDSSNTPPPATNSGPPPNNVPSDVTDRYG